MTPWHLEWQQWPLLVLTAGLPALSLALSAADRSATRSSRRVRTSLEWLVVLAAAVAVWRLVTVGQSAAAGSGADPVATAAPVLLGLAAGIVTLRIQPLLLRLLSGAQRRGRALVGFLGSRRALHNSNPVILVSVVMAVALATAGVSVPASIDTGIRQAALERTGADVNLSGPPFSEAVAEELAALPGVTNVELIYDTRERRRLTGTEESTAMVWLTSEEMGNQMVLGGDVADLTGNIGVAGLPEVQVVSSQETLPSSAASGAWVLLGRDFWIANGGGNPISRLALLTLKPQADPELVAAEALELVGGGQARTIADHVEQMESQPLVERLGGILLGLTVMTMAAMVAAIVAAWSMGAQQRGHLFGVLRVLGTRRGELTTLVWSELLPILVLAAPVGIGTGLATSALLAGSLDFSGMTGAADLPLSSGGIWLAAVVGILLLTAVAIGVLGSMRAARAELGELSREAS